MHLSLTLLLFLSCSAVAAGLIDTLAGGGGLIALPAILAVGLPPSLALGTNKFQATFGVAMASWRFARKGHLKLRESLLGIVCCILGASIGTLSVLHINSNALAKILPILLLGVLLYTLFSPRISAEDQTHRLHPRWFFIIFGLMLGFYDGFLGPGTGSFWVVALIALLGFNLKKATMHAKLYNFTSNLVALCWFISAGKVLYLPAIMMAVGQMIGAYVGAHLVMQQGHRLIRPVFIVMVTLMLLVLAKKYW
jgi:uncharacterized membrane protein YfcA